MLSHPIILSHYISECFLFGNFLILFYTPQVNLVVNYDLPVKPGSREADCETYLHRIGRTGRFGKTGNAINIVEGRSDILILKEIESHFSESLIVLVSVGMEGYISHCILLPSSSSSSCPPPPPQPNRQLRHLDFRLILANS